MEQSAGATRYSALLRRDAVCDEFERAWRDGNRPDLASFAARVSASDEQRGLTRELIEIELHYRRALGETPELADYAARYPQWAALIVSVWRTNESGVGLSPSGADDTSPRLPTWIGKYRIVERLGSGGQAEVYRGVHPELGLEVAIKWYRHALPPGAGWGPTREGKVLAELNHPGLAKVYDLDVCEGFPYLVLEYVAGVNLEVFARQQTLGGDRACEIVADLAAAMAYAHERGVVHHDIKPANVLVQSDGRVRLIDFGLARVRLAWQADVHDGRVAGTATYMAPEQARGEPADPRADVFALGGVLYFLLTGHAPFEAASTEAALERAKRGELDERTLARAGIPRGLSQVMRRAMAADAARRLGTAGALQHELTRWRAKRLRRPLLLSITAALALLVPCLIVWRPWSNAASSVESEQQLAPTILPYGSPPGLGHDIAVGLDFEDLALVMTFDPTSIVEHEGDTFVRDLSSRGLHGKTVNIDFNPNGRWGQALRMGKGGVEVPRALLDHRTEYTLSCWIYFVSQEHGGVFYSEHLTQGWDRGDTCFFSVTEDGRIGVGAWNIRHPKLWVGEQTPPHVVPERQWCFVAITLRNGGIDQGELTVQVDDQKYLLKSQQICSNPPDFPARTSVVGANSALDRGFPGMLDHLWIFTRALSQDEIDLLRTTGRPAVRESAP
jgi:serine/threonine protein kinase